MLKRFLATVCLCAAAGTALAADPPVGLFSTPSDPGALQTGARAGAATRDTPVVINRPGTAATAPVVEASTSAARAAEVPETLSEFQKFVQGATGRVLPRFGARFFQESADSGGSLADVPVSADYVVGPGDEIVVRAWGSIDIDFRTTVDRNGQINLPKVGSFSVAGIKASDLDRHLRAQIGRLFTNFELSVSLGQLRGVKVFVVGPARKPGVYTLPSQSTLLSAVVAAGGPDSVGSMRTLSLRRGDKVVSELDVYDFLVRGDKSKDLQLAAGDVIVFHPVGPRVALTGALDTPAIYELRTAREPLEDLLRYAGGTPILSNPHRVLLERVDTTRPRGAARYVDQFALDASGRRTLVQDGDIVTLLPISPQFANAVTLKGHVAQPLRSPWVPGMRVRDLIPSPEALITPDFYRRKNELVQIAGESADEVTPGRVRRGAARDDVTATARARQTPTALFDEINWEFAIIERLNVADLKTQIIPFDLGRAVLQGDPSDNIELRPGDVITIYSQKDIRVPVSRQTRLVSIEGEVAAPGVYQLQPGETLQQLLVRAGGITPQAYLYGLEFTREETRRKQRENLATAIARLDAMAATQVAKDIANRRDDANAAAAQAVSTQAIQAQRARLVRLEPNGRIALELQPNTRTIAELPELPLDNADRISVPTRPGFVSVAGAVVNENAYIWKSGRTVGDYVKLAGLNETADPSMMFILRADGTVSHSVNRRGLFGYGDLASLPLYPGDAVIVPNLLDLETWGRALVRNLKDFSQIFYQFGLGAAAIRTLRN